MARNNPALAEPLTAEETSLMDADRDSEYSQPEPAPEPAPEPDPAPEPEAAAPEPEPEHAEPEIDPATGKQRKVDYGALHAEREKRRAAEGREREKGEQLAKLMGRFEVLQQLAQQKPGAQQQPQAEAQTEIPDINVDPVGHFEARARIAEKQIAEVSQWRADQQKQSETQSRVDQIRQIAQSHEAEFAKANPDYNDAFQYLRQNRDAELEAMGYNDPSVRQQIINQDALQIAAQALQRNGNAAETVYKMAKARGWAAKPPAPPSTPATHPDTVKIKTVAKGQQAGQSLGQANGSAPAETGVQAILAMSDADFAKWATDDNWRKLMGG